jgi:diguanylate cyclase
VDAEGDSSNIIDSIRTQLEGLKRTEDGSLLYRLIERGLGKSPQDNASTDEAFLTFMYTLLERYAKNRDGDPITRIKVRVIQQRITPYLMHEEELTTETEAAPVSEEATEEVESKEAVEAEPEEAAETEPVPKAAEPETGETEIAEPDAASDKEGGAQKDEKPAETKSVVESESEKPGNNEPEEFDLELIDSDEIDRELQAEEEKLPPPKVTRGSAPVTEAKQSKTEKPKPVEKKSNKKVEVKPKPTTAGKKKPAKAKPKAKPKVAAKSPLELKVSEKPKKPVKLELVEPTDLTKPHAPREITGESEEGYIDLGGDAPTPTGKAKGSPPKPAVKGANKKNVKTAKAPARKQSQPKQQLMPKGAPVEKAKTKPTPQSGEPSQERVEKLHEAFVHKMAESITRSQEYHRMLRSHMKAIELADGKNDFKDLKSLLMRGMEDLLKGNETLGRDLDSTSHYLKIARLDRALLKDELGRIKSNTTIDELTALQNKEAFVKQLESEISRVNRYGFSFAIAVLDIDDLKSINTTYGRDAGDEVIRCYARQILSQFRSYDLVARHKSDEFLLLFPNTQKEGALRAVEKAQKRAANLFINHKDKNIKVPTFTSVLTTYAPGDQPDTLLRRTTEALVQAQRRGRDQVILALPTS